MTTIELRDGYFIELDDMNSTLKKRYIGKNKDKVEKEMVKTIGYYPKPIDAIERFICLNRLDKMDGMELSISEYVNELKKADREVIEFLKKMGEQTDGTI